MKDVVLWELKRRRTALLWWSIGSVVLAVFIMALFPSISDQAAQLNKVLNTLPPELRGLKTGGAKSVDVGDPVEFLNAQVFYATLPILWIILSVTRGAGILGREEQSHTLELLLARPISRVRLLAAKALAYTGEFAVVCGATLLAIVVCAPLFELHVGSDKLAITTLYTALFSMSFGYIAFALQAASRFTKRSATAVAVAIGFGGYIVASLSSLTDWLKWPVKFMPYHYFVPLDPLQGKSPRGLLVYLVAVFVIGTTIALLGFRHRDID
ncbi:ABC transporter permease subunit [Candidatus Saccharibacteria bacterium]|nr:MAG: ABC transporter permease subunit [Candidatus Saccharibacteria bacterium]